MLFSVVNYAENEPTIYSEGAVLIEANTGTVLYEKNSNETTQQSNNKCIQRLRNC